ncbi:hypothetical protein ACFE04_001508 [Oxalis oulophora]
MTLTKLEGVITLCWFHVLGTRLKRDTCAFLLRDLQLIWDTKRDEMLLELEQECLDLYRRKVDKTRNLRLMFVHQTLAAPQSEIANLISALEEHSSFSQIFSLNRSFFLFNKSAIM